jgi:Cys-tRNA(Pro)/Cys-tRNA(Cys) deacylase
MKKKFPTIIDESCLGLEKIAVSAGQRGMQVELKTQDLIDVVQAKIAHVTR